MSFKALPRQGQGKGKADQGQMEKGQRMVNQQPSAYSLAAAAAARHIKAITRRRTISGPSLLTEVVLTGAPGGAQGNAELAEGGTWCTTLQSGHGYCLSAPH